MDTNDYDALMTTLTGLLAEVVALNARQVITNERQTTINEQQVITNHRLELLILELIRQRRNGNPN